MNRPNEVRWAKRSPGGIAFLSPLFFTLILFATTQLFAAERKTVEEWADIGLKATDREP